MFALSGTDSDSDLELPKIEKKNKKKKQVTSPPVGFPLVIVYTQKKKSSCVLRSDSALQRVSQNILDILLTHSLLYFNFKYIDQ